MWVVERAATARRVVFSGRPRKCAASGGRPVEILTNNTTLLGMFHFVSLWFARMFRVCSCLVLAFLFRSIEWFEIIQEGTRGCSP